MELKDFLLRLVEAMSATPEINAAAGRCMLTPAVPVLTLVVPMLILVVPVLTSLGFSA